MQPAPEMPPAGIEGWSPGRLIFVGVLIGFLLARLIEPAPPTRVIRFRVMDGPGPELGAH
jgi:hypothetical protein